MKPLFDPDTLYRPKSPEMRRIGTPGGLATMRCKGQGPPYFKIGTKVAYRGSDLNEWMESRYVVPPDNAHERAAQRGAA